MLVTRPIALSIVLVIACARTEPGGSGGSSTTTTSGAGETTSQPMTTTTTSGATSSTATTGDAVSTSTAPGSLATGEESTAATATTSDDADSTTTTTGGGEGTTTSTTTTGDPFEECIAELGPAYTCAECACLHCTAELDACAADMGCHEIWKCVRETGCGPTNQDCLGPCGDIFFQYGGLFAPSAMLVSAINTCVDDQCAGQC